MIHKKSMLTCMTYDICILIVFVRDKRVYCNAMAMQPGRKLRETLYFCLRPFKTYCSPFSVSIFLYFVQNNLSNHSKLGLDEWKGRSIQYLTGFTQGFVIKEKHEILED